MLSIRPKQGKFNSVIDQIVECHEKGQPVLVGTISIEKSELLSKMLKKRGIKHEVLNAKYHEKEAEIIAQAGKKGAVTIATNMAGRGTDIMLGGNAEWLAKADMRKAGMTDELISEATSYAETDNQEVLDARATYKELYEKHKEIVSAKPRRSARRAGFSYSAPNATSHAVSTISCAAAPAVRATRANRGFTFLLKTILCACSAANAFRTLWRRSALRTTSRSRTRC